MKFNSSVWILNRRDCFVLRTFCYDTLINNKEIMFYYILKILICLIIKVSDIIELNNRHSHT